MSLYQKASLVQIPSGYKAADDKLYSVVPSNGNGDFTIDSDADATRINKDGLIESVVADQARLNYDFTNPQDPHLLLEPTRTQLAGYPTAITSANGYGLTNGTLTANDSTAPDGSLTASTFEATSALGQFQKVKGGSSGVEYSVSVYVKRKTGTGTVYLRAVENTNTAVTVTDEWTRVSATVTSTSTNVRFGMALGTSGDEIYVWGFQVEAGSYPTSFIPNADNSEVTRTADTVKIDDFTDAPTDYPFTIFCDFDLVKTGQKSFMFSFLWLASSSNYFAVGYNVDGGGNFFKFENRAQGTALGVKTTSTYTEGRYKLAIKFVSSTNFKAFIDGLEVADHTHTAISFNSAIKDFLLGQLRVSGDTGDRTPIHQFMVFNEALTDSELQTLTS